MGRSSRRKEVRRAQYGSKDIAEIVAALHAVEVRYNRINFAWIEALDMLRTSRGKSGFPNWPEWCLLPMGAVADVASEVLQVVQTRFVAFSGPGEPNAVLTAMREMAALYSWRQGRGIYRFDDDLVEALLETEGTDSLPVEALMHPPEWGVCVVVPQKLQPVIGCSAFISHLQWNIEGSRRELRVSLLSENENGPILVGLQPLHLDMGTISEGIDGSYGFYVQRHQQLGQNSDSVRRVGTAMERSIESHRVLYPPILALLAYLGSAEADIVSPCEKPITEPLHARRGAKESVRRYEVGYRVGAVLRKGIADRYHSSLRGDGSGRSVIPHLRRAHWHHYWTGPKSDPDKRELVVRWIHPVLVGGSETIPTVRPVVGDVADVFRREHD